MYLLVNSKKNTGDYTVKQPTSNSMKIKYHEFYNTTTTDHQTIQPVCKVSYMILLLWFQNN